MFVKVLKMMVGTNLTETQLQQIVDKTIVQLDKDQDGMISYEEFCGIISKVSAWNDRSGVYRTYHDRVRVITMLMKMSPLLLQ